MNSLDFEKLSLPLIFVGLSRTKNLWNLWSAVFNSTDLYLPWIWTCSDKGFKEARRELLSFYRQLSKAEIGAVFWSSVIILNSPQKFHEFLEGSNLITKLQAKHDVLKRTLGEGTAMTATIHSFAFFYSCIYSSLSYPKWISIHLSSAPTYLRAGSYTFLFYFPPFLWTLWAISIRPFSLLAFSYSHSPLVLI